MSSRTKRNERNEQFRDHGGPGGMSFSQELLGSAFELLRLALEQRTRDVWRERANHYTSHAPGALVLVVTAFDVWTTEFTVGLDPWDATLRRVGELPICERYAKLLKRLSVAPAPQEAELRAVVDTRDEVVHYLPRTLPGRALPAWMEQLDRRGLLIKARAPGADFTLSQKLCSYALAFWAFSTLSSCVDSLIKATPANLVPFVGGPTGENFLRIGAFAAPERLTELDVQRGLPVSSEP